MGPVSLNTAALAYFNTYPTVEPGRERPVAAPPSAGAPAASEAGISQLTVTASMVHSRVETFLASFDEALPSDQQLRMMIALLILQALLGKEDDQPMSKAAELAGIAVGLEVLGRRPDPAIISATNIIQIQHQSTLVYTEQAVQTLTESGGHSGGQDATGARLDVSG